MMNNKLKFLTEDFIQHLVNLPANTKPVWGLMNVQQMIEHMSDSIRIANGKHPHTIVTPADKLDLMRAFMLSDKEFKPNTKNSLLPDTPAEPINKNKAEAIEELNNEINDFVNHFNNNNLKTEVNPFFGNLNYDEWLHLFHKHAVHHLKQFGVVL